MSRLLTIAKPLRSILGQPSSKSVALVAERFLQVFREHGVETAQIPRLLPQIRLEDLQSPEHLLATLTPDLLDQVAKLFGIRVQWLEGQDDRIYDYLAAYKEPRTLLDHLCQLWQHPSWANEVGCPLRILATTDRLDYRNDQRHELAPVLVEPIATLGDETVYRYHVYQDGLSWDHPPARIELKAIALTTYKALHRPIPIFRISQRDMDDLLEGGRIPRSLLGSCLTTDPSLEDYVLDSNESTVAKETDELPTVREYMAREGLDIYDFRTPVSNEPASQPAANSVSNDSKPSPSPSNTTGKRQAQRSLWQKIEAAAITLWAQDKTLSISQLVRQLQMIPEIKAFALQADTIRKRIAKFAPEGIRGKSGRKPKQSG